MLYTQQKNLSIYFSDRYKSASVTIVNSNLQNVKTIVNIHYFKNSNFVEKSLFYSLFDFPIIVSFYISISYFLTFFMHFVDFICCFIDEVCMFEM